MRRYRRDEFSWLLICFVWRPNEFLVELLKLDGQMWLRVFYFIFLFEEKEGLSRIHLLTLRSSAATLRSFFPNPIPARSVFLVRILWLQHFPWPATPSWSAVAGNSEAGYCCKSGITKVVLLMCPFCSCLLGASTAASIHMRLLERWCCCRTVAWSGGSIYVQPGKRQGVSWGKEFVVCFLPFQSGYHSKPI